MKSSPTLLDLGELLHSHGMRASTDVDVPCIPAMELDCVTPITGSLVFTNTGNMLVIQGEVRVTLNTQCPRCLVDTRVVIDAEVDDEFTVNDNEIVCRAEEGDTADDPAFRALFPEAHILDLSELCRQSVVLAMPMETLCREDCAGLCPYCGANRNETTCACEPPVDSPFAALAGYHPAEDGTD